MLRGFPAESETGTQGGDLLSLEEIDQPDEHRLDFSGIPNGVKIGERVYDNGTGLEIGDKVVDSDEVHLQSVDIRPDSMKTEEILTRKTAKINDDDTHL